MKRKKSTRCGKKEAPPVQDMPDETEHPALSEKKKPRVSKLLYRIIAALLIAVVLLIILENKDNLTPENIGNWIRTKAVGFGFGDGYPAELTGSTALVGNFGAADGNLYVVSDTALTVLNGSRKGDVLCAPQLQRPRGLRSERTLPFV